MKLFQRREELPATPDKRMARLANAEYQTLLSWFDNTIMGLGASFDQWRYHDAPIDEVIQHVDALQALLMEIRERKKV